MLLSGLRSLTLPPLPREPQGAVRVLSGLAVALHLSGTTGAVAVTLLSSGLDLRPFLAVANLLAASRTLDLSLALRWAAPSRHYLHLLHLHFLARHPHVLHICRLLACSERGQVADALQPDALSNPPALIYTAVLLPHKHLMLPIGKHQKYPEGPSYHVRLRGNLQKNVSNSGLNASLVA